MNPDKFFRIVNAAVLGLLLSICVLGTLGHIAFGYGLGDLFYAFLLYLAAIVHLVLTIVLQKKGAALHGIMAAVFLYFIIFMALKATIYRGVEYSWNGRIFYGSDPVMISVNNDNTEKEVKVAMKQMEYHSAFSGIWNGRQITAIKGEILIPKKLEDYITRPITTVWIIPVSTWGTPHFSNDKLVIGLRYYFGRTEIMAVKNHQPVMSANIIIKGKGRDGIEDRSLIMEDADSSAVKKIEKAANKKSFVVNYDSGRAVKYTAEKIGLDAGLPVIMVTFWEDHYDYGDWTGGYEYSYYFYYKDHKIQKITYPGQDDNLLEENSDQPEWLIPFRRFAFELPSMLNEETEEIETIRKLLRNPAD